MGHLAECGRAVDSEFDGDPELSGDGRDFELGGVSEFSGGWLAVVALVGGGS
ncbi:hypothetical protein RchiOBHm_Chr7g0216211 [Rosa chinensis]|uniref:Uncharacterized protein n=1 Tax=Rosa chinensis TaxID=74649 RepID=A0A2P6PBP5_ROSCH|nr:hypothetical protein RchiOBHm_Chr7g0216211 [Rosa chinensis]